MSDQSNETSIGRRTFLKAASFAAAGAAIAPSLTGTAVAQAAAAPSGNRGSRRLGSLEVSSIGFGSMNLAGIFIPRTEQAEAVKVIRAAYEGGVTLFDTAQSYGPHYGEEQVGEALEPFRDEVVIATKFGYDIDPETRQNNGLNGRPDNIKKSVEGSLKRLRTDRIDLFYQHRLDPNGLSRMWPGPFRTS